jgi:hypothetical protein
LKNYDYENLDEALHPEYLDIGPSEENWKAADVKKIVDTMARTKLTLFRNFY